MKGSNIHYLRVYEAPKDSAYIVKFSTRSQATNWTKEVVTFNSTKEFQVRAHRLVDVRFGREMFMIITEDQDQVCSLCTDAPTLPILSSGREQSVFWHQ